MKKISFIAMLLIGVLLSSCGSSVGSTPEETAQKFYTALQGQDYATASDMFSPLVVNVFWGGRVPSGDASEARKSRIAELKDNPGDAFTNIYQGIKTITVDKVVYNDAKTEAEVTVLLTFGIDPNFTSKTRQDLTLEDGKWYITELSF
ncbi:MAG: hypothetical protein R3Y49_07995 [Rikenellaceae bacterium]